MFFCSLYRNDLRAFRLLYRVFYALIVSQRLFHAIVNMKVGSWHIKYLINYKTHSRLIRLEARLKTGTLSVLFETNTSDWFVITASDSFLFLTFDWSIRSAVFSKLLLKIGDFDWAASSFCFITPILGIAFGLLTSVIRIAPSGDFVFSIPENSAFASSKIFKSSVCERLYNFFWISFGVFSISVNCPSVNRPSDCSNSGDSSAELLVSTTRVSVP